jgi:hypothetical protein
MPPFYQLAPAAADQPEARADRQVAQPWRRPITIGMGLAHHAIADDADPNLGQPGISLCSCAFSEDLDLASSAQWEPPAERDQRGGPAGKGAEHLGADGVAGDGRVRQGPRGDSLEPADLLAGEPADLIELMHSHVHEDAPATRAEARRRRLLVPLIAGDMIEIAQLAGDDTRLQLPQAGH